MLYVYPSYYSVSIMGADEYLMLSGIQHFAFCKRQWALIHIEQLWQENYLTYSGQVLHNNADDPYFTESRGDILISRAVPLISHALRIYGVADVVEYQRSGEGVIIPERVGFWKVIPVEYKHGKKKPDDCDEVQLCAQAMCLEEMMNTRISHGFLFYGKTRRRVEISFDEKLRGRVAELIDAMYDLYEHGITPPAVYQKHCDSCSLVNVCMPHLSTCGSASAYLQKTLRREL